MDNWYKRIKKHSDKFAIFFLVHLGYIAIVKIRACVFLNLCECTVEKANDCVIYLCVRIFVCVYV